jgi:hypothetical protein
VAVVAPVLPFAPAVQPVAVEPVKPLIAVVSGAVVVSTPAPASPNPITAPVVGDRPTWVQTQSTMPNPMPTQTRNLAPIRPAPDPGSMMSFSEFQQPARKSERNNSTWGPQ